MFSKPQRFFKTVCMHTCLYVRACDFAAWGYGVALRRQRRGKKKISPGIVRQLDEVMGSSQRKDGVIRKAKTTCEDFFEEVTKATFLSGVLITHNYDQDQLSWFSELNFFTTCKVVYPAGITI